MTNAHLSELGFANQIDPRDQENHTHDEWSGRFELRYVHPQHSFPIGQESHQSKQNDNDTQHGE